jgi:nucleoside-diphosphate-sugar epimerase
MKGETASIDAKVYTPNEYVYAKDVAYALQLACRAADPKQRTHNAGSGVVTGPEALAQIAKELAPMRASKSSLRAAASKSAPLDLSASKAELGYTPRFPLREALRDYLEELWSEQRS